MRAELHRSQALVRESKAKVTVAEAEIARLRGELQGERSSKDRLIALMARADRIGLSVSRGEDRVGDRGGDR